MIERRFDILAENDPYFLQELRRLLDGLESGEYQMQNASLTVPYTVEPKADGGYPKAQPSGHIVLWMLLYKQPLSETVNSTVQKPPTSGGETDETKISSDCPSSVSNS